MPRNRQSPSPCRATWNATPLSSITSPAKVLCIHLAAFVKELFEFAVAHEENSKAQHCRQQPKQKVSHKKSSYLTNEPLPHRTCFKNSLHLLLNSCALQNNTLQNFRNLSFLIPKRNKSSDKVAGTPVSQQSQSLSSSASQAPSVVPAFSPPQKKPKW